MEFIKYDSIVIERCSVEFYIREYIGITRIISTVFNNGEIFDVIYDSIIFIENEIIFVW